MEKWPLNMFGSLLFVVCAVSAWEDDGEWRLVDKICGAKGNAMEAAVVEESVMNMDIVRNGYYTAYSQSLQMTGLCESHLDVCECLQCFTHAIHMCPFSLSAQIRLTMCSLSYSYQPTSSPSGNQVRFFYSHALHHNFLLINSEINAGVNNSSSNSTKRIAAIVVGAGVAVFFALLLLFFLTSRYSKRDYYY